MNRMITELESAKAKEKARKDFDPWAKHRKYYRKKVDIECMYRPVQDKERVNLWGQMKDLSRTGMCLEVPETNSFQCSHEPGDEFFASAFLPTGKRLDVQVKIARAYDPPKKGLLSFGMLFLNLNESIRKTLGFFLMR
jgi:c-di-GMP-binding flagellar brake protein YcgR